ncbi:phosphate/phosphite/phosphonate ABC transporter substrate-binding protein [Nocardioides sp. NPDC057772]|uniref:phosphate/phosphite/phosphonate ABC transporter substrate-binding protein n=1 Tax=Nocardioides sp. NPDC057772 TaxID=3346245 RepID=UPI00366C29B8
MRLHVPVALAAGAALVLSGCSAGSESSASAGDDVIRFATLPLGDDPKATTPVAAVTDLLEAETGKKVEVTDVPSYSAVIEAIRNGHQDIGIMSGFPSALAVSTGEVDSLVAWPGEDEPVSTCLVLDDSPLKSLSDIDADTVIAFADPASSSGYFMPTHMLHEAGLEADKDYNKLMSGGHDRSFIALKNGQADVACTSTIFPSMAGQGDPLFPFEKGETRSIGESISMPISITVLGSKDMSEEKRAALLDAIPQVFATENADKLGVYAEGIPSGVEPIIEPREDEFQPFVDIAKIADVDISELE